MTLIGKLVGRGAAAIGVGAALAIALTPQPGLAVRPSEATNVRVSAGAEGDKAAPTAQCVAARAALAAVLKQDATEDTSERALVKTGATSADVTEDTTEFGALKPLIVAMHTACAPAEEKSEKHTPPTPTCAAARQALMTFVKQQHEDIDSEGQSHWGSDNGLGDTETSDPDQSQDVAVAAKFKTLMKAVMTACGFDSEFER